MPFYVLPLVNPYVWMVWLPLVDCVQPIGPITACCQAEKKPEKKLLNDLASCDWTIN